jgi:endonuclease G, mitochondrial
MSRLEALRDIGRDAELRDEILDRIAQRSGRVEELARTELGLETLGGAAAPSGVGTLAPARLSADAARELVTDPPPIPVDAGLEAIVLLLGRPVLLVRHDDVDLSAVETDTWRQRLEQAQPVLRSAIRSVGRIEVRNNPQLDWVGTGWLVTDDVVVTNRHVASEFARREGDGFVFRSSFLGPMEASIDFSEELGGGAPAEVRLVEVLHVEDDGGPDLAFLRVERLDGGAPRSPIRLGADASQGTGVAVIGYPAKDTRTRVPEEMDRIFGSVYDVKRLAPGEVTSVSAGSALLTHDCTTLGGNSGSVVLDLVTGEAAALHFAGREMDRNFAVPSATVRSRLDEVLGRPRPSPVSPAPSVPQPRAPRAEDMASRTGYESDFLGVDVPHPALAPELEAALAPVSGREDGILDYTHYSLRMHRHRRLAMYTVVNIDGLAARNVRRARDRWSLDPRIDTAFQAGNELYERNKLDRGHLVRRLDPAWGEDFATAEAAAEDTFFYTNCAPQHEVHNQRLWLGLEDYILGNADVRDLRVTVFSGPVFSDNDRLYRGMLIPEDFWKVVAMVDAETGRLSVTGYVVSQRDLVDDIEFVFGPYKTFQVPVATIEQQTHLDFGGLKDFDPVGHAEARAVRPLSGPEDIRL